MSRPVVRRLTLGLAMLLYLTAIGIDAVRKSAGLTTSTDGLIYVIVAVMYLMLLPGRRDSPRTAPRYLPVWLTMLSFWCLVDALIPRIPLTMALLGWTSYVFFVPLVYIGVDLFRTDRGATRALWTVTVAGALLGLGATVSAVLGQSAPAILQPIVPSAGLHSFSTGNIYLAPSVFATAEQAAEQLLIALFAWIALTSLPGRPRRLTSALLGVLIAVGLFATARRADIAVAALGTAVVLFLGRGARRRGARGALRQAAEAVTSRVGPALALGLIGSIALVYFLGVSRLAPFLTSTSDGTSALQLMVSPPRTHALLGQGTGTSTQGASVLGATAFTGTQDNQTYEGYVQGGVRYMTAEGGFTKTWLELGVVGMVLYAGMFFTVLGPVVRGVGRLDGVGRALTVLTIALGVIFLKGHASLDDPLVQPLFWLAAGGIWGRARTPAIRLIPPIGVPANEAAPIRFRTDAGTRPRLG